MLLNTNKIVTITDANQNFSKVARIVDKEKSVLVMKNNKPKYVIIEFEEFNKDSANVEETIDGIANKILYKNIDAFKELAKWKKFQLNK